MTSPLQPTGARRGMSWMGPWFAALWLFFLVDPLRVGWSQRSEAEGLAGIVATVAFAAVYLGVWIRARIDRHRLVTQPRLDAALGYVGVLVALGVAMVLLLGEAGLASAVYIAVACVMVLPLRVAAPTVLALTLLVLGLGAVEDWGSQVGTAFGVVAASFAIFGLRAVLSRNIELIRAHQENAALAVENERTRFARDLHDILGHSLTVITVKAELARKLIDVDVDRTRSELADLERLSRDALADVRRAVAGYRDLTLPGELVRARAALASAGVEAEVPGSADDVPSELRDLFAWSVREGVTNVIRHADARHCEVRLSPDAVEIRDDGVGPTGGIGAGLAGLRERAGAVGAVVVTAPANPGGTRPGHLLRVGRP